MVMYIVLFIVGTALGHVMRVAINSAASVAAATLRAASPAHAKGSDHLQYLLLNTNLPEYTPVTPVTPRAQQPATAIPTPATPEKKQVFTVEAYRKALSDKIKIWWSCLEDHTVAAAVADDKTLLSTAVTPEAWAPHVGAALCKGVASEAGIPHELAIGAFRENFMDNTVSLLNFRMLAVNYLAPSWIACGNSGIPTVLAIAALCENKDLDPEECAKPLLAAASAITQDVPQLLNTITKQSLYSDKAHASWLSLKMRAGV